MTFSEFIIKERSKEFYIISLSDIVKCSSTIEDYFKDLYFDYQLLINN